MHIFNFYKPSQNKLTAWKAKMSRVGIFTLGIAGIQIILTTKLDARKTFVIGISLIFGLSVDILPELYRNIHPWLRPLFSSSLTLSTILAIVLTQVFRIGSGKPQTNGAPAK